MALPYPCITFVVHTGRKVDGGRVLAIHFVPVGIRRIGVIMRMIPDIRVLMLVLYQLDKMVRLVPER